MSNRQPSRIAVRLMPPTTVSDSSTVGVTPCLASSYAAVRPAGPAPMMTTLWWSESAGPCSRVGSDVFTASLLLVGTCRARSLGKPAPRRGVGAWLQSPPVSSPDRGPGDTDHPVRRYYRRARWAAPRPGSCSRWMLAIGRLDFLQSHGLDGFYDAQADAWLDGRWDIPRERLGFEAFIVDGKAYEYFGPFPALLRVPFAGFDSLDGRLTQVSIFAAFAVLLVATSRLLWRVRSARPQGSRAHARRVRRGRRIRLRRGRGIRRDVPREPPDRLPRGRTVGRGLGDRRRSPPCSISSPGQTGVRSRSPPSRGALAMLTRGSVGVAPIVALGIVFVAVGLDVIARRTNWRSLAAPRRWCAVGGPADGPTYLGWMFAALIVPVAFYSMVNFVKFDHPWEIPIDKQIATVIDPVRPGIFETTDGSLFAPKFVPTAAWAVFRPDAIAFDGVFPFVTFPARADVIGDITFASVDPAASLPASMPLLFVVGIVGTVAIWRPRRDGPGLAPLRTLTIGGLAAGFGVITIPFVNQRYLSDFMPLLVVVAAAGLHVIVRWAYDAPPARRPWVRAVACRGRRARDRLGVVQRRSGVAVSTRVQPVHRECRACCVRPLPTRARRAPARWSAPSGSPRFRPARRTRAGRNRLRRRRLRGRVLDRRRHVVPDRADSGVGVPPAHGDVRRTSGGNARDVAPRRPRRRARPTRGRARRRRPGAAAAHIAPSRRSRSPASHSLRRRANPSPSTSSTTPAPASSKSTPTASACFEIVYLLAPEPVDHRRNSGGARPTLDFSGTVELDPVATPFCVDLTCLGAAVSSESARAGNEDSRPRGKRGRAGRCAR